MSVKAGRICGNVTSGLCERACIEVKKIFDGCTSRTPDVPFTLKLTGFSPGLTPPYTFSGAKSHGFAEVRDFVLGEEDGSGRSEATFTVTVPVTVEYSDQAGNIGRAEGSAAVSRSARFLLPTDLDYPYAVEAAMSVFGQNGMFLSDDTVSFTACVLTVARVTAVVEMLVPTYGYCVYPECESASSRCPGITARPLFRT